MDGKNYRVSKNNTTTNTTNNNQDASERDLLSSIQIDGSWNDKKRKNDMKMDITAYEFRDSAFLLCRTEVEGKC